MEATPTTPRDPILADIEAFLVSTGVTPTAFGQRALNDPTLVHELRKGRECKRATRSRIQEFIRVQIEKMAGERAA